MLVLVAAAIHGETLPSARDAAWSLAAGVGGAVGITALYRGLAIGQMGMVAPITAVLSAGVPVVAGGIVEGPPGPIRAIGIVLAFVAVFLVSRASAPGAGREGIGLALLAGLGLGMFLVFISGVTDGLVFGPLAIARVADVTIIVAVIAAARQPWRVGRAVLPPIIVVGVLDIAGNAFFILAAQSGRLDVAAVLSSLYPVTTILLAAYVLHERLVRGHRLGVALALVAIVLITAG